MERVYYSLPYINKELKMSWDQTEFNKYQKSWLNNFNKKMEFYFGKRVRARTKKGTYKKDDPSTPENEAYTTTKAAFSP